jgi:hypothetical protein
MPENSAVCSTWNNYLWKLWMFHVEHSWREWFWTIFFPLGPYFQIKY